MVCTRIAELRYVGQGFELPVTMTGPVDHTGIEKLARDFHSEHERVYGFAKPTESLELVNLRVVAVGTVRKPELAPAELDAPASDHAVVAQRPVYFDGEFIPSPVVDRTLLRPGNRLIGPAVIEQLDSTTVLPPNHELAVDGYENLVVQVGGV